MSKICFWFSDPVFSQFVPCPFQLVVCWFGIRCLHPVPRRPGCVSEPRCLARDGDSEAPGALLRVPISLTPPLLCSPSTLEVARQLRCSMRAGQTPLRLQRSCNEPARASRSVTLAALLFWKGHFTQRRIQLKLNEPGPARLSRSRVAQPVPWPFRSLRRC